MYIVHMNEALDNSVDIDEIPHQTHLGVITIKWLKELPFYIRKWNSDATYQILQEEAGNLFKIWISLKCTWKFCML